MFNLLSFLVLVQFNTALVPHRKHDNICYQEATYISYHGGKSCISCADNVRKITCDKCFKPYHDKVKAPHFFSLGNSNPNYTLCNQTFCDRIREVPSSSFTKYNSGMAGYHYHKKESKYSWQNIYSKDILDFSWIKNPTIK